MNPYLQRRCLCQVAMLIWAPLAWSQEPEPARTAPGDTNAPAAMAPIFVYGTNTLGEELPLGENQQPEWTARRRFVTTRIYVQPPWQVETELGYDGAFPRTGTPQHLIQEEIELGLPYRFQFDIENVNQNFQEGSDTREWHHESVSTELRWALADWGKIPLNPTVNLEWKFNDGDADAFECQLLLGDEFGPRWHWGLNLFWEQQVGADRVRELAASQAVSYTVVDQKLGAGVEMKFRSESDKDSRNNPENWMQLGPSIQWRPTRRTHLDLVPLFGLNGSAPVCEVFIFFGFEFGHGSIENERVNPASLRGK